MRQNVCSKWLFQRKKFQWKPITITMSVLVVSFLIFLCVVYLRLVAETTYVVNKKRRYENKILFFCVSSSFCSFAFQETDPFNRVNLVIPGSLLPFKKEINSIFEKEKQNLFRKKRYAKVFRDKCILPIFSKRKNQKTW